MCWLAFLMVLWIVCSLWVVVVRAGLVSFTPALLPGGGERDIALGPPGCEPFVDCVDSSFSLAASDFDGDGHVDLVTANNLSSDLSVLLGDGTGSFAVAEPIPVGDQPVAIVAGDLDGDEVLDLVVANEAAGTLGVLRGDGEGGFAAGPDVELGGAVDNPPSDVVLADVDGDGDLDAVTVSLIADFRTVLLGKGDGTFSAPARTVLEGGPVKLAAGRLDGDDALDLVVSLNDSAAVRVFVGDGDGGFAAGGTFPVAEFPTGVAIADFDGDGNADAAVASDFFDVVSVLLGNGDGTLGAAEDFDVGSAPQDVAVADFDGDERLDIVTADSFGTFDLANSVSVLAGRGDGGFDAAEMFEVGTAPFEVAVADVDGDRRPDVVTVNMESNDVSVLLNSAEGVFGCVGDCNGDERVTIEELILGVDISTGGAAVEACPEIDADDSRAAEVHELISAVGNALSGCPR